MDLDSTLATGGFIGSLLGALGITKYVHKKHEEKLADHDIQIKKLKEEIDDKPSRKDCVNMRQQCPVFMKIDIEEKLLTDLKTAVTNLNLKIDSEFSKHQDLHLNIATNLGKLVQSVESLCNKEKKEK